MPGTNFNSGYSNVNGIRMYYETYGEGKPLVLIHGGGSTIQSTFSRLIPLLTEYKLIAVELQNHGRSGFRDKPETFEQDAADVAVLLKNTGISKASILGFSNGGTTTFQLVKQFPGMIDKIIVIAGGYRRDGFLEGFFESMNGATLENMPKPLQDAFLTLNPDPAKLQIMFERDRDRMINFPDYPDELLSTIKAPALIINGDTDVITNEHAVKMQRLIPGAQLAVIPGYHGQCIGESTWTDEQVKYIGFTVTLINDFLRN